MEDRVGFECEVLMGGACWSDPAAAQDSICCGLTSTVLTSVPEIGYILD